VDAAIAPRQSDLLGGLPEVDPRRRDRLGRDRASLHVERRDGAGRTTESKASQNPG
jgi:hypothetical protein